MPKTKASKTSKASKHRLDSLLDPNTSDPIFALPSHSATPSNNAITAAASSGSAYVPYQFDGLEEQQKQEQEQADAETVLVGRPSPSSSPHPQSQASPRVPPIWQSTSTSVLRLNQQTQAEPHINRSLRFESQQQPQYVRPSLQGAYLPHHQQSLPVQFEHNQSHQSECSHPQFPPFHQQSLPIPQLSEFTLHPSPHLPDPSNRYAQPQHGVQPQLAASGSGIRPPTYEAHNFEQQPPIVGQTDENSVGRFPRWRGWLEKRALERHYNRLDSNALSRELGLSDPLGPSEELRIEYDSSGRPLLSEEMARRLAKKKSWGKSRAEDDALSDEEKLDPDYRAGQNEDERTPVSIIISRCNGQE